MILTLTPHPALDYTIRLDGIELGRRGRYREPRIDPSGKGINASRLLQRLGASTLALGFSAGHTGALLEAELAREGVPHEFLRVGGLTRINVTLLTGAEGTATHLHGPGSAVSGEDVVALLRLVSARLAGAKALLLSGSLPPGMPDAVCGDLVRLAREAGVPSIVDMEGGPLIETLRDRPSVVKPNRLEAERFVGRPLKTDEEILEAAAQLVAAGAGSVVVTNGAEGALAMSGGRVWKVSAPREEVVRAVGAGDSFAAGLALGISRGLDFTEALRLGSAAGAATARAPGSGLGSAEDVERLKDQVQIRQLR